MPRYPQSPLAPATTLMRSADLAVDGDLPLPDRVAQDVARCIEVWRTGSQRDARRLDERAAHT